MEQLVLDYFKKVMAAGFPNQGRLESPTVRVDSKTENINICETGDRDQLYLDLKVERGTVVEIKYQCDLCDPTGFVTSEILCELVSGKGLGDLNNFSFEDFENRLGGASEQLRRHVQGALQLLKVAVTRTSSASQV
jgi:NifU-like protein involved in Fe-S cluster formation